MKAIQATGVGGPEVLFVGEAPLPSFSEYEIMVKVAATAVNRADTLQRKGMYPSPQGASPILGLEMAGEIVEIGAKVTKWKIGDRVCGLLSGGGHAACCPIHEDLALPIPDQMSMEQAAAIPEVFLTAFQAIHLLADIKPKESVLIHAGASGVGTALIQLAKSFTHEIYVTASSPKHELCTQLGAQTCIDYKTQDFAEEIAQLTDQKGVDILVDFLAAPYFQRNLHALALDGRMVMLALMGGIKVSEVNLIPILRKRISIHGSTLRNRSHAYKVALNHAFSAQYWKAFEKGNLNPVIHTIMDWTEIAEAHRMMEANENAGKIVLRIT